MGILISGNKKGERRCCMTVNDLSFGSITIDGITYLKDEVYDIAIRKGVTLVTMSTPEAIKHINDPRTNLILQLTC